MLMMGNMMTITIMMMVVIFGSVYDGGLRPRIDHPLKTDQKSPLARITLKVMVKLVIRAARMKNMMIVMVGYGVSVCSGKRCKTAVLRIW